jgi:tetratricopeptide (TPR) repeat protein
LEAVRGSGKRETIARLDLEIENIATALDWLAAHGRRTDVAEMCWSMWSYHWLRGALAQGRRWTRGALAAEGSLPSGPRARLLASDGFLAFLQRQYDTAGPELLEALEIAKREGDDDVSLRASVLLPLVFGGTGEQERARSLAAEGLRLARTSQDRWAEVMALTGLCWLNAAFGHFAGEEGTFDDALVAAHELDDPLLLAMALNHMADLRMWQGRYTEAATLLAESVALFGDLRMVTAGSSCLHSIAIFLARLDRWAIAVRLQAASDAAMQSIETGLWSPWLPRRERLLSDARQSLGDVEFDHALATGQAWTFDEAVGAASTALANVAGTADIQPAG